MYFRIRHAQSFQGGYADDAEEQQIVDVDKVAQGANDD
jgi:hypothetical protein